MNVVVNLIDRLKRRFSSLPFGVPGLDQRDRIAVPPENYVEQLNSFVIEVANCMHVSRKFGGVPSHSGRHFFGSVLFTSLVTRSVTLVFAAPYSPWSRHDFEHWDYASVANITRTIMETRLAFFYLCSDTCPDIEWDCRWNLFNLNDCVARISVMSAIDAEQDEKGLTEQADEIRDRLRNNAFFRRFPPKKQSEFLRGGKAYLKPLEEIAVSSGMELKTFRIIWKFTSAQIHSLPLSFYRMGDAERGTGVQTLIEEQYTTMLLSFAMLCLVEVRDEYIKMVGSISSIPD